MDKSIRIEELAIVVVARNHNPTLLNPDFLKYNDIVPPDWELAEAPICADPFAQVVFTNGVTIVAQFDKVIFSEKVISKPIDGVKIPRVAHKYVETLPHVDYRAVGINPKGHVSFEHEEGGARRFLVETLLSPGPWREFGNALVSVGLKFHYRLEQRQFNLTVEEPPAQIENDQGDSVVIFSANFHHDLELENRQKRLQEVFRVIDDWQTDVEMYSECINKMFLVQGAQ